MVTLGVALMFVALLGLLLAEIYAIIWVLPAFWGVLREFLSLRVLAQSVGVLAFLMLAAWLVLPIG